MMPIFTSCTIYAVHTAPDRMLPGPGAVVKSDYI